MDWDFAKDLLMGMGIGALIGFCCGAGCGEPATTWNELGFQGMEGALGGAGAVGVLMILALLLLDR